MPDRIEAPCRLATLGMFIIDEFQFIDPVTGADEGDHGLGDQVGGGGTYFTIGARVWLPSSQLSMVIDRGDDFPAPVQADLQRYEASDKVETENKSMWRYRQRGDGYGTTRALNIYKGQQRGFKYLTPKIRLDPHDQLYRLGTGLVLPSYIHFICSPERAGLIVDEVEDLLRNGTAQNSKRPALVWEPIPDSAIPENLDECIGVMKRIDVFSPNHDEAASLLSVEQALVNVPSTSSEVSADSAGREDVAQKVRNAIIEMIAQPLLRLSAEPASEQDRTRTPFEKRRCFGEYGPIVQIRSGALGSLVTHRLTGSRWVRAYHTPSEADAGAIKDVTGAGNACLGGFTAALALMEETLAEALSSSATSIGNVAPGSTTSAIELLAGCAAKGSVSASFVIEQQGLPFFDRQGGQERWNNSLPAERLKRLDLSG
ncbi:hypothetical protein OC861_000361 [Tilletia horrida]|nr:hypothetical protein OC861_000361 [Tilletia horrida]